MSLCTRSGAKLEKDLKRISGGSRPFGQMPSVERKLSELRVEGSSRLLTSKGRDGWFAVVIILETSLGQFEKRKHHCGSLTLSAVKIEEKVAKLN